MSRHLSSVDDGEPELTVIPTCCLSHCSDDLYQMLLNALLLRIRDKEAPVRVHAIVALAKLQSGDEELDDEDEDEDDDDYASSSKSILQHLVNTARMDPNAEVRRAALFNLPINYVTLPYILERLRDIDATNRRCVYVGSLNGGPTQKGPLAELSSEQSHQVIKTGLGEREETVFKACKKLINAWTDKDGGEAIKVSHDWPPVPCYEQSILREAICRNSLLHSSSTASMV